MSKEFQGVDIKEVWDFRLSTAVPAIHNGGGTWVVEIWSKINPDYDPTDPSTLAKPLEIFDTGIVTTEGDEHDAEKYKVCYEWLYSVRDKYSLPAIEEMKPHVAKINAANAALAQLGAQ